MKKHISKNAKSSIILCVVAYPIAYLIAAILWVYPKFCVNTAER